MFVDDSTSNWGRIYLNYGKTWIAVHTSQGAFDFSTGSKGVSYMSKGYESRIRDEITSDIGTLYTDHYSILKELVQNADDAGANELSVVFLHPSKRYSHPLLAGPLLLFVNDAKFTSENAQAIHQRRNSDKTADGSKIGMFGLGLKSLFHLCQAFFYVSSPEVIPAKEVEKVWKFRRSDILNPWGNERFREWNDVLDSDLTLLKEVSSSFVFGPSKDWFALIVPLRLRRHCIERATQNPRRFAFSTAEDSFFDESAGSPPPLLFSEEVLCDLPRLMPLLSTLNRLSFWTADDSSSRVHFGTVERIPELHTNWRQMKLERVPQAGRIEVLLGATRSTVSYYYGGLQQKMLSADLELVRARDAWPEIWPDDESAESPVKVDIAQHSAVIFLDGNGAEPFRGFLDTVFLPLIRGTQQEISVNAPKCTEVLLHAARFPDSARKKIDRLEEGRSEGEESVRQVWNRVIEVQGILPLLIPALDVYSKMVAVKATGQDGINLLTRELGDSAYFKKHRTIVCQSVGWAWRLTERGFAWSVVALRDCQSVLVLPAFGEDHFLPTSVFTSLNKLAGSILITVSGVHGLFPTSEWEQNRRLPEGVFKTLLTSVVASDVALDEKKLKYLADAVTTWKRGFEESDSRSVISILRAILKEVPAPSEPQRRDIRRLLGIVPAKTLLPILLPSAKPIEVWNIFTSMLDCATDVLPVPSGLLEVDGRSFAQLSTKETKALLLAILGAREKVENSSDEKTSAAQIIINNTLRAWASAPLETFEVFNDLLLFHGSQTKVKRWYSLSALKEQNARGVVFQGDASSLKKFTNGLETSENNKLVFLTRDATEILAEWIGTPPKCDVKGFIELLKRKPKLSANLTARAACIEATTANCLFENDSDARLAIRYLIHGELAAYDNEASLLLNSGDAWSEMAKAILLARKEEWRFVPGRLVNFKPTDKQLLGIVDCNGQNVSQLVVGLPDPGHVDCSEIVKDHARYRSILEGWPDGSLDQLKKLKAFPDVKTRELVAITDDTFIEGDFSSGFDSVFPNRVFVTDETGMLKRRALAPTVEPRDLIARVLKFENPSQHWKPIMDSLSLVDQE